MTASKWKASAFLAKTSNKPIQYCVLGILATAIAFTVLSLKYEVNAKVVVFGEVISKSGDHEVISPNDGVLELQPLSIGQIISENEVIGRIKIPFTDDQKIIEILKKMHDLFEVASDKSTLGELNWPNLDSENPVIAEQLLKSKELLEVYNNEIQNKIKLVDLKTRNLIENRKNLQKRVAILSNSKNRLLTESLTEEQKRDITLINEELAKIENDHIKKSSESRNQLLATLKNSYLKIYQYQDSHLVKSFSKGKISKTLIAKAQQVKKDQPVVVLSPIEEEFEFKLQIPTYLVGKISAGLQLRGEIDSFPYQKFGMFKGSISRIDKILTHSETKSYYSAFTTIEAPRDLSRNLASSIQLLPGMKVKANIVLKKVPLAQLIYEKLFLPNDDP